MLLPVFQDLIKPQWVAVLERLKFSGGMPVSELCAEVGASYMAVKQHCEELRALGYVRRSRIPRVAVGRPEIFYSLGEKADALFPQAGGAFTLELLDESRALYGDHTPEKLLFQYFERCRSRWEPMMARLERAEQRLKKLAELRSRDGCGCRYLDQDGGPARMEDHHHPMRRIFAAYPRAEQMEQRMFEQLVGARLRRQSVAGSRNGSDRVVFSLADS